MRVVITTQWTMTQVGGVPSHITYLMKAMAQASHQYAFVNPDERFRSIVWKFVALAKGRGIDSGRVELTKYRMANLRTKLIGLLSQRPFDLVHAHDVLSGRVVLDLGLPVVLTVHGPLSKEIRMLFGNRSPYYLHFATECERLVYARAAQIITVDSGQRDIIVGEFGVTAEKVHVIPNPVDTEVFAPGCAREVRRRYLLVPRRLVKKNAVDVAIRALGYVRDPSVELWIAGEGPEERRLRSLVRAIGLQRRVRFLGSVMHGARLAALMAGARAVIIPSVPVEGVIEATSIAALEAMSVGVPVLASRIGGLVEIIEDGKTGFLFEAGDERALARLIELVLSEDRAGLVEQVGRAASMYVRERHSLKAWFSRVINVYQSALYGRDT